MSTKIYEAYVLPVSDFNAFANAVKQHAIKKAAELYAVHIMDEVDRWFAFLGMGKDKNFLDELSRVTGWKLWMMDGMIYAFPYGTMNNGLNMAELLPSVKKFHYWNNVDADENVSDDEWSKRGSVWHEILDHPEKYPSFSLVTFDLSNFVGVWEVSDIQEKAGVKREERNQKP